MSKNKEVKLLLAKAQAKISELAEFEQFLGTVDESNLDDAVYFEIEFRLNGVRDLSEEYKEVFIQLSAVSTEKEDIMSIGDFLKTFITVNSRSNAILSKKPSKAETSNSNTSFSRPNINQNVNARLPKLQVPVFNGDYVNFTSYYETFTALIHNNPILTDVERFMYLRDSLKGTASQLISNIQPTGDNYKIAFALLCERFNNPKLIVNSHVKGIFELKTIAKENATDIRNLYDDLNKHLRALDNVTISFDNRAIFISHILMTKFDSNTQREFSKFKPKGILTMQEINDFLKERCQILEEIEANKSSSNNTSNNSFKFDYSKNNYSRNNNFGKSNQQFKQSFALTSNKVSCPNCKQNHSLNHCPEFLALSVNQRIDRAGELRTCRNCLYHSNQNVCNSRYTCQICQRKHHTLLHLDQGRNQTSGQSRANSAQTNQTAPGPSSREDAAANTQTTLSCFSVNLQQVLLPTAVIQVKGRDKKWRRARVLLDSGSHINLITEEMANELQLNREKINTTILGINSCSANSSSVVNVKISSLNNNYRAQLSCVTVRRIAENLPLNSFNKNNLRLPENIRLADENYNTSAKIDILIGAALFYNLMSVGQISLGENKPVLQKTVFGWIVSGVISDRPKYQNIACSNFLMIDDDQNNKSLEKSVERFWQLENVQPKFEISKLSPEERFCETHFQETVMRDPHGRFSVSIPFNSKLADLGESKSQAMNRFIRLEKSLQKRPELHLEYKKFMHEYIALGHMKLIENYETNQNSIITLNSKVSLSAVPEYFLPHHAVEKPNSLTTKVRVVFDGSAKTTSGVSINDTQLVGPVVQNELFSILLHFRQHVIALTGDIEKMYRQILIDPAERRFQQILWRDNPEAPINTYQLQTVTYGTASASYLATKCLQHLANLNSKNFPATSKIIKNCFYMDDLLTGGDTVQEVLTIQSELTAILASAGLPIRKFLSNSSEIMENAPSSDSNLLMVPLGDRAHAKALGILWNSLDDVIQYDMMEKSSHTRNTKRTILSVLTQLFDPLGLLSPVIVRGKLIIQKLWQLKVSWDESIPQNLNTEWLQFREQFRNLNLLRIPRCVKLANPAELQLHGFSDSSTAAYGACVYVRCCDASNNISTRLVCSKSRVSPSHGNTIPRLELCAALLLAQLVEKVKQSLTINFSKVILWTDSTIVLHWIKSTPNKYKTFVCNRIASIQELSTPNQWSHVRSQDNPADLVSRGTSVQDIIDNPIWFSGPNFLSLSPENWPIQITRTPNLPEAEFKNKSDVTMNFVYLNTDSIFCKFSKLVKLQRVVAWILRFKNNVKLSKSLRLSGALNTFELQKSMNTLIKLCQAESLSQELKLLKAKKILKPTSNILALNPFLDENGIMRVGGRIKNSDFSFSKKFPVLLPKDHLFTKLIFKQFHEKLLHCGPQQLLACVREQFWPISGRNSARDMVHNCVKCFKACPKTHNPLMGDLPLKRIQPNMPVFSNVGVDYAGPILIKDRKTRGAKLLKSYICLFVCLVTKAIHIELVTDLTAEAFISALKRFISRRGKPVLISSDNAKNFLGASNQLRDFYQFLNSNRAKDEITNFLSSQNIKWEFITPRAPHEGGLWEAGIKSTKLHLKRILGNTALNYEDFQTVLVQIEATLNSRPLCPISADPSDFNPLTPGHFIIGKPLCALPEPDYTETVANRLSRYQQIQRLVQGFWKRWNREVIPEMQRRTKWFRHLPTLLKVDSVVLIQEDNLPPLQWLLGRVTEVHATQDNIPRSATVITSSGHQLKRSVRKLCVLPRE